VKAGLLSTTARISRPDGARLYYYYR